MNKILMSTQIPQIVESLSIFDYEIIDSDKIEELLDFEQKHIDMQCLKIEDTYFVLRNAVNLKRKLISLGLKVIETNISASKKYPNNCLLNCVYIKNMLLGKENAIDENVINYCKSKNIKIINVNQGYTKCSTAIIKDGFITADKGIYDTLTKNSIDGLLINPGEIELNGVDYGFIGGCCFCDDNNVYFTGDITKHSNYKDIKNFCDNLKLNIVCLSENKLYDIGGFIKI